MPKSIGLEFLKKTRYRYLDPSDQTRGLPQPSLEAACDPAAPVISLPDPKAMEVDPVTVQTAISRRRSIRRYSGTPLRLEELSYLLWCTQGVQRILPSATVRNVPSAGARHCFETWLLINRVENLSAGLYRYLALRHLLLPVNRESGVRESVVRGCLGQEFVGESGATFIWVADAYRMTWRYGERGYRYILLDAGHVCQNLYLAGETIGCGVCAVAAFDDDELNRVLGIDGNCQFAVYVAAAGKRE
jgi:SagB-type dehydrogenase family enzyme